MQLNEILVNWVLKNNCKYGRLADKEDYLQDAALALATIKNKKFKTKLHRKRYTTRVIINYLNQQKLKYKRTYGCSYSVLRKIYKFKSLQRAGVSDEEICKKLEIPEKTRPFYTNYPLRGHDFIGIDKTHHYTERLEDYLNRDLMTEYENNIIDLYLQGDNFIVMSNKLGIQPRKLYQDFNKLILKIREYNQ